MIPNSVFLENRVTNWTLSSSKMRRNLRVGVAYGSQPQKVMEILTESAGRHGLICKNPEPFAVFDDFGDSALIFTLYFWVELGGSTNAMIVASDLRLMIEKRFTEMEIGVPYPQRDMHLTTDKPIEVRLAKE
jgi:small-conductance mechanosensitive channel